MAKDGDIIDVMFGWVVSLFGWLLGLVVKLVMAIIGGIFNLIVGIFKKKDTSEDMPIDPMAEEIVKE